MPQPTATPIRGVLFDFGGVIAREGFLDTMTRAALAKSLDPQHVMQAAIDAMYGSGFLTNTAGEERFWELFAAKSGLAGDRDSMRESILSGCVPRQEMLGLAGALAVTGKKTAILSDHTSWLDELERRHRFFIHYEYVFNSYHTGVTKREPESFSQALAAMELAPGEALFIDDAKRNVAVAKEVGLHAIHFAEDAAFAQEMLHYVPDVAPFLLPFMGTA